MMPCAAGLAPLSGRPGAPVRPAWRPCQAGLEAFLDRAGL